MLCFVQERSILSFRKPAPVTIPEKVNCLEPIGPPHVTDICAQVENTLSSISQMQTKGNVPEEVTKPDRKQGTARIVDHQLGQRSTE